MEYTYKNNFEHLTEICAIMRRILSPEKNDAKELSEYLRMKEEASKIPLALVTVKERFGLSRFEYLCLMLAVAAEIDRDLRFSFIKTALDIYSHVCRADETVYQSFAKDKPLYLLLIFFDGGQFRLRDEVYRYIIGGLCPDGKELTLFDTAGMPDMPDLYALEKTNIVNFLKKADTPVLIKINAPSGSGKKTLAKQICFELKKNALFMSVPEGIDRDGLGELVNRAVCVSKMTGSITIVSNGGEIAYDIAKRDKTAFLCAETDLRVTDADCTGVSVYEVTLRTPDAKMLTVMWEHAGAGLKLEIDLLAERYRLTAGQIASVSKTVLNLKAAGLSGISDTEAVCSEIGRLNKRCVLTQLISPKFGMGDLIIDANTKKKLDDALTTLRLRQKVYDEYGYGRLFPYGRGIGILLYGAPGTGKTMAVHALAKELGLDILAADISRIVDKYIGETEKHLNEIFETASRSNCILFFDEADSLFAKRTDVGDSRDRSANTQTAHLLQKMEAYGGAVILATNLADNIDEAFKRRLPYIIEFQRPDAALREKLWRGFIPSELPVENIDFSYLSQTFELTPAIIKWTAFAAAVKAVSLKTPLSTEHILGALAYEYEKTGTAFPDKPYNDIVIID